MRVLAGFWRPLSFYFGFDCKFAVLSSRLKQVAVHENGMKYVYQGPDVYQTDEMHMVTLWAWEIDFFLVFIWFEKTFVAISSQAVVVEPWRKPDTCNG